jgi:hypothetical protein
VAASLLWTFSFKEHIMPVSSTWGFEYESPSSLPGITLTGGPGGGSPILAVQVDAALNTVSGRIDDVEDDITAINADIADLENDITAGQASITNLTNWSRVGTVSMSFTTLNSSTASVSFGFTFPAAPRVLGNIDSGAGSTAGWVARPISITTTGFTMFVFQAAGTTSTWAAIPVNWVATYRP